MIDEEVFGWSRQRNVAPLVLLTVPVVGETVGDVGDIVAVGAGVSGVSVAVEVGVGDGVGDGDGVAVGVGVEGDVAVGEGVGDGATEVAVGSSGTPQTVTPPDGFTANASDVLGKPMIAGAGVTPSDPASASTAIDWVWPASVAGSLISNTMG